MFAAIGIRLIDFKLEFGRVWDGDYARVILADEISPDGCRLWDMKTNKKLDKDRFRQDLGGVEEAYQEVARRLGLLAARRRFRSARPRQPSQEAGQVAVRPPGLDPGPAFSSLKSMQKGRQAPAQGRGDGLCTATRIVTLNAALGPLDYRVPDRMHVEPGSIVVAPLGPRQLLGVAWEAERLPTSEVPDARLRPLAGVLDVQPIAAPLRRLCEWTADYYLAPLASVLRMVLPSSPRSTARAS